MKLHEGLREIPSSSETDGSYKSSAPGCGSPVVKVSDHGRHVMSSSPVSLKTRRVGERCMLNLSRAETPSRCIICKFILISVVVVTYAASSTVTSDQGPRNSSRQGASCTPVVSRSIEHHTGDSTIWHGSTSILRENALGVVRGLPISSPSTHLTRGLVARGLFRVSPCPKGTIHLQTSMLSPGFEPRPYGTASFSSFWSSPVTFVIHNDLQSERAVGSLVVRASDSRPEGLGSMPPNTLRVHMDLHAEIVEVKIEVVSPSIVPSGNFAELNRTVTCMVLKANDWRTSCPCHDEFRGPRSD
ncbi:hypothetical protein TNCV_298851 [Trichonephila clavipes]|nr:hypothetical protein TNCV_298851 [Trichonephila clavipes]